MAIGDIIKKDGYDLLILDYIDGCPFVLALNTGIRTATINKEHPGEWGYLDTLLCDKTMEWFNSTNFKAKPRQIHMLTYCGDKNSETHNSIVAPLTFDEYRKYYSIIKPHINTTFWLSTPYNGDSVRTYQCSVDSYGFASISSVFSVLALLPAFIITNHTSDSLDNFTTEQLIAEIYRRSCKE